MRRTITSFVVALLLVASALAAQDGHRFRLFAGLEPGVSHSDETGFDYQTGYVLGLDTYFAPRWAAEVAASYQRESGPAGPGSFNSDTISLDAAARFELARRGRWGVHGLAGLRYSEHEDTVSYSPPCCPDELTRGSYTQDRTGLLVGLGADLQLSKRFSLRLDAKHVPWTAGGDDAFFEDTAVSTALGVEF